MTVYATAQITIAVTVDAQAVDVYYCQTAITASQPTIDTTSADPSGWSSTEPAYDSSKQLWTCVKTTLSDGTFYWGAVSKSSSYSGANAAYNAAVGATRLANSAVASSEPLYYRSTVQTAPTIGASTAIGESASTSNAWERVMPKPKHGCWFFTCTRFVHVNGSVTFSDVRTLDNATYTSMWCAEADDTYIDGGALYNNSVTTDKLAANSVTIGALAEDVTGRLDGMDESIAESAGLSYRCGWVLSDGTYTFDAHAYRGGVEITDEIPDEFFTWYLRTESGDALQDTVGPAFAIAAAAAGYRASVLGGLEESLTLTLTDASGTALTTASGEPLEAYMEL